MTDEVKLDIFEALNKIDRRDVTYFANLPEEVRKKFAPIVFMRWYSGTSNPTHIKLVNRLLNPMVFNLYKHPDLMWKLFVAMSDGKSKRYNWIKKKSKDKSAPTVTGLVAEYYQVSRERASQYRKRFTLEDILEMAEEVGYDNDQVKKIKAELK